MTNTIDINDLSLQEEQMDLNPEGDAFGFPPPPPDGTYVVTLKLAKNGFEEREIKRGANAGGKYLNANIEARIVSDDEGLKDKVFFDAASTIVMKGANTCRIAGILGALGAAVPARISNVELCRKLNEALGLEPQCRVTIQWEAYSKEQEKTLLRGMKKFPANADGAHKHTFNDPNTGEELSARAAIVRYLPLAG